MISPLTHYFRHVILNYKGSGERIQKKFVINKALNSIQRECFVLQEKNPYDKKVKSILQSIDRIKGRL
jgi:hypothetical protein